MSKIQGADVKTEAQLITAGADKTSLIRDTQIYVTGNSINKTLDDAIIDGDLGGAGAGWNFTTRTANYTAAARDFVLASTNSFTVTLPSAAANTGQSIAIQKTDADVTKVITISPNIQGASRALYTQHDTVVIASDGTNWNVVARYNKTSLASFTPTGSLTTNATYSGFWERVADIMHFQVEIEFSGANTQGAYNITMPFSLNIDTAKLALNAGNLNLGTCSIFDASFTSYYGIVRFTSATEVTPRVLGASGSFTIGLAIDTSANQPMTIANGDKIYAAFSVPIVGWW